MSTQHPDRLPGGGFNPPSLQTVPDDAAVVWTPPANPNLDTNELYRGYYQIVVTVTDSLGNQFTDSIVLEVWWD
jgi:hypothetical protein